jgi:hypothetical protein
MRRASCESWVFTGRPEMPSGRSRAELVAELTELHELQLKSLTDATYVGWTREEMVAHQKRSDRIVVLQRELGALDGMA